MARDAYNGVVLWQVMFPDWHPIYIRDKETPVQIQRRLAAVGDVVYCTPGYSAPITALRCGHRHGDQEPTRAPQRLWSSCMTGASCTSSRATSPTSRTAR